MLTDNELHFSDEQAITAAAASDNVVDLQVARDIGTGEDLYLVATVTEAFTDAGSNSTLAVKAQTDSDSAFGSPTDAQDLFTFAALSAVGTTKIAKLAPGAIDERYMRLYYTPANGDLSTGKVSAFITKDVSKWKAYASGSTIG